MLRRAAKTLRRIEPLVPAPLKELAVWRRLVRSRAAAHDGVDKHDHELRYWSKRFDLEGGTLTNGWYERDMLAMAGEKSGDFLAGKIVADFGCGPRGSLEWATAARARIGIDALVDRYARFGIARHSMVYVESTESRIPLPTGYVDVLFTMNALDHVADLPTMVNELVRILAPGGLLVGSFNLYEPATATEPQTLTPELLDGLLFRHFVETSQRIRPKGRGMSAYEYFIGPNAAEAPPVDRSKPAVLWFRGTRPRS